MNDGDDQLINIEDFTRYDWQERVETAGFLECWPMNRHFDRLYGETPETDKVGRNVYRFLTLATSGFIESHEAHAPFRPVFETSTGRWPIPDDIPTDEIHLLAELAPLTRDPELRARIADVAWLRARDFQAARLAVSSYIESARRLLAANNWMDSLQRSERALRIAAQLGASHLDIAGAVVDYLEEVLGSPEPTDGKELLPARFMELLIEFGVGDKDRWSTYAEELAERSEQEGDLDRAKDYWTTKAAWEQRRGNEDGRRAAETRAAEVQVRIADSYLVRSEPDYLSSAIQLQMAVDMFRQAGARERAEECHKELLSREQYSYKQMKSVSHSIDIREYVERATDAVRGHALIPALLRLAVLVELPSVDALRERAIASLTEAPFASLLSSSRVDHLGRVVANKPSFHSDDPTEVESAVEAEMFEYAAELQRLASQASIRPGREQILREHSVGERDLLPLVRDNPLVPFGRHSLVLRGLSAGLHDDFPVATHLLVPQIENSIRHTLNSMGVVTSKLIFDGIQQDYDLGWLLSQPETSRVFDESLIFDLRGLLAERFGSNYRNLLAHGLLNYWELGGARAEYLWWLALRFYCLPILMQQVQAKVASAESEYEGEYSI